MSKSKVEVGILKTNSMKCEFVEIEDELSVYQEVVEGILDYVHVKDDIGFFCNDEGLLINLPRNLVIHYEKTDDVAEIAGNTIWVKHNADGEVISLTEEDKEYIIKNLKPEIVFYNNGRSEIRPVIKINL